MEKKYDDLVKKEIKENYDAISKLKKLMPLGVIVMTAFSFIYPLIPLRRSETLTELVGYPYSVFAMLILSGLTYFFGYKIAVKRRKNNIIKLEMKLRGEKTE